ncbi:ABC transporter substrate-binding protein [Hydrogenophaga sp.]|uniref:ABC transporter substrate-binding protein n=1 Tax=Hydrogenophaga sp. TaxID=1904254 RepID=UPI002720A72F|nr:ABC transporter substrate-binding protein [Hydrogenophaga sp.]MDO9436269.1 ABC transporter substrate-binding protein [Hydrogenophaga sp.]
MATESHVDLQWLQRRTLLKAAGAAGGLWLPGAAALAQASAASDGNTLLVSTTTNPTSLEPMAGRINTDMIVLYALFDALIDFDPDTMELKPGIARSWTFPDPKRMVLTLADNVLFHDGTPCDAEAVKFNLEMYRTDARSAVKGDLIDIDRVEVTGPLQVTLHLKRANFGLPTRLTYRAGLMVSPKQVKEKGAQFASAPVGSGPYKFVEFRDGDLLKVERFDKYYRAGLPKMAHIQFRIITDANTCARTAITGQAHIAVSLLPAQKPLGDRSTVASVISHQSLPFWGTLFNVSKAPLNDIRVRKALNHAMNRADMNRAAFVGLCEPSCTLIGKTHWAGDSVSTDFYPHDIDKAKQLLAEAGFPNGIDLECNAWSDQGSQQRNEVYVAQMAKANIRIKIIPSTPAQASTFFMQGRGHMYSGPSGGIIDPGQNFDYHFGENAARNAAKVAYPGYTELSDAVASAGTNEARKAALVKLNRFVVENALMQPFVISTTVQIVSNKVKGHKANRIGGAKWTEQSLSA